MFTIKKITSNKKYIHKILKQNTTWKKISLFATCICVAYNFNKIQNYMYKKYIILNRVSILNIPKHKLTPDMCEFLVMEDSDEFKYMADELKTQKICDYVISKNIKLFEYIPDQFKTKTMCDHVFSKNKKSFEYIPDQFKTKTMCDVALKESWKAFYHEPRYHLNFFDDALDLDQWKAWTMDIALQQSLRWAIHHIPKHLITSEMYEYVVNQNSELFAIVPNELKSDALCKLAITNNNSMARYLPESKNNLTCIKTLLSDTHSDDNIYKIYMLQYIHKQTTDISQLEHLDDIFEYLTENDILHTIDPEILSQLKPNQVANLVLTGLQFNTYFPHLKLRKITNPKKGYHNSYKFNLSLNNDQNNFDPLTNCNNGIYFSTNPDKWESMYNCQTEHCDLYDVQIPPDAIVRIEDNKFKSNLVILDNKRTYESQQ